MELDPDTGSTQAGMLWSRPGNLALSAAIDMACIMGEQSATIMSPSGPANRMPRSRLFGGKTDGQAGTGRSRRHGPDRQETQA